MTSFTRTWNAAYEAQPADTENISLGASRIRNFKSDVQEREEVDHSWAGDAADGEHKKITFAAPISTPSNIADKGFLYGKNVNSKIELHYLDEDGNEIPLTSAGGAAAFPANTSMLFYQSAAPTGWTKDTTTLNNHAIRVVSSTAWSGGSKGATGFTSVFGSSKVTGSHALTEAELASHTHTQKYEITSNRSAGAGAWFNVDGTGNNGSETGSAGSGSGHTHTLSLDLNYINMIRATKD